MIRYGNYCHNIEEYISESTETVMAVWNIDEIQIWLEGFIFLFFLLQLGFTLRNASEAGLQ